MLKPAGETTLTALRVAKLTVEAGLPAGVLNAVPGGVADVGKPLGRHPDVDMISSTGSTVTGKRFLGHSGGWGS